MSQHLGKTVVIGHINPDTDSVCSAIAYAALKNKTGTGVYEPRRAGKLNPETAFVLEYFGLEAPRLCTDVSPKVRHIDYRRFDPVDGEMSLRRGWALMRDAQMDTLPVADAQGRLEGLVSVKDIATANMDVLDAHVLARTRTSYRNILDTLDARMLVGDENACVERGKIVIGASSPEIMEHSLEPGDIVLLSNRYESQLCAIEMQAGLIILCQDAPAAQTIQKLAQRQGVDIMVTSADLYAASRRLSQSVAIRHFMTREGLVTFTPMTAVDDVLHIMGKYRYRYFPVVDGDGTYRGMLSRRNVIGMEKRRLILVDHNETAQAVEGWSETRILEIIDHHRIGDLQTAGPVYFRNQPLGSTATIVAQLYAEQGLTPEPPIAGALLGAILSDTLAFRSPTSTPVDRQVALKLAQLAGVELEDFAARMFEAGESLEGKTAQELLRRDLKVFTCGDTRFAVAQGYYMTRKNLLAARDLLLPVLSEAPAQYHVEDLYVLLTDVPAGKSLLLTAGRTAGRTAAEAFGFSLGQAAPELENVISRKKQFLPPIMAAYQR